MRLDDETRNIVWYPLVDIGRMNKGLFLNEPAPQKLSKAHICIKTPRRPGPYSHQRFHLFSAHPKTHTPIV